MHIIALVLFALLAFFIITRETFIAAFNDMIDRSTDPIFVNYHGRERDWRGMDYYDHFLNDQLLYENLTAVRQRQNK